VPTFVFGWRDDPRRTEEWYERQCAVLPPQVVAHELDCDFAASVEGVLIPLAWAQAAVGAHTKLGIPIAGIRRTALDVADEGSNQCCLASRHGILLGHLHSWSGKGSDLFASCQKAFGLVDEWGFSTMNFDADGLGAGLSGIARALNEARQEAGRLPIGVDEYRGSAAPMDPDELYLPESDRTNADMFANRKAQSWLGLRRRFELTWPAVTQGRRVDPDALISIDPGLPELSELLVELNTPTFKLNQAGKFTINKVPDGARSPDRADSVVMAFGAELSTIEIWRRLAELEAAESGRRL
jgi:phage terminase large subunit